MGSRRLTPVVLLAVLAVPALSAAQSPAQVGGPGPERPPVAHARATRLYVGMWTSHVKEDRRHALANNWAAGVAVRGYFGATFLNSYGRRAFTAGIQRTLAATKPARAHVFVGYRLGVLTGYDRRLMPLAARTPVLPLVQPFVCVDIGHAGVELSYTFVVLSVATSYRF